jgi:hypothetical protein
LVALALGGCGIALLLSPPVALPRHSSIPGLKAGDICHAASSSGFIWAAPDRWSLEDYLKLTAANDQQGLQEMLAKDRLVKVPAGTKARIIVGPHRLRDNDWCYEVRFLDGDASGQTLYTLYDWLAADIKLEAKK